MDEVRIDRWLWAVRFFKTRHVVLNGARVKPSKSVRVGDAVDIRAGLTAWSVHVTGLAEKRGPASVAAGLYRETEESVALREERTLQRRLGSASGADLGARPTKRDRRRLDALQKARRRLSE